MKKRSIAILTAGLLSCLNIGDKPPLAAQPLEINSAVRIPGPMIVIQKPLELSLDQRLSAQQIIWECQMRETLRHHGRTHRSTDAAMLDQNPLPVLSSFLSEAYHALSRQ